MRTHFVAPCVALLSAAALLCTTLSAQPPAVLMGVPAPNYRAAAHMALAGRGLNLGLPAPAPPLEPRFDFRFRPLQDSGHRVGKAALVFGVLGVAGVVGGVILANRSSSDSSCSDSPQTCTDIHKAAKFVIAGSAVVAGLGFFFGLRHAF